MFQWPVQTNTNVADISCFLYLWFSLQWVVHRPVTRESVGGEVPLEKFFAPAQEKFVRYILKLLDIFQKILAPLRKLFAPPGVPSWLRAWLCMVFAMLKILKQKCHFPICLSFAFQSTRNLSRPMAWMCGWSFSPM